MEVITLLSPKHWKYLNLLKVLIRIQSRFFLSAVLFYPVLKIEKPEMMGNMVNKLNNSTELTIFSK